MSLLKPSSVLNETGAYTYKKGVSSSTLNYIDNHFPDLLVRAGGQVTGLLEFLSGSTAQFNAGSTITFDAATVANLVLGNSSTLSTIPGTTVNLNLGNTSSLTSDPSGGTTFGLVIGNAGGIQGNVPFAIKSGADGGIQLSGSIADWIYFAAPRSLTNLYALQPTLSQTGSWSFNASTQVGILSQAINSAMQFPNIPVHYGATSDSVVITFTVGQAHAGIPGILPKFQMYRVSAAGVLSSLSSTGAQSPAPGSAAAWYNGGVAQTFTFVSDQNNTIDTPNYTYFFAITDEGGGDALTGNIYHSIQINQSNITTTQLSS